MNLLVLPGFSLKNKDWAENIKKGLGNKFNVYIAYWKHWTQGKADPDWIENEVKSLSTSIKPNSSLIAHSVGCIVAMKILQKNQTIFNKIILCGIPLYDFQKGDRNLFKILANQNLEKVLCVQNINDNHGSFAETKKFLHSIDPQINVVSKAASDHRYPYVELFNDFINK